jgi:chromosome segregation ATPase
MRMTSSSSDRTFDKFTTVRRGYAPDEVSAHISRLVGSLDAAHQERASIAKRVDELTAGLDAAKAELAAARAELTAAHTDADALREELDRAAGQPISMSGLSARMQRLFQIAEEESADIRSSADRYAAEVRSQADSEAGERRRTAEAETSQLRADTVAELAKLREDTETEMARAQDEIEASRAELEQTRTTVYEQAKRLMAEAHASAESTLAEARERAEHLSTTAAADRAKQEEDYELAIEARRRQAHRAIVEAEQTARADAAHRVDQANTHARNIVESANAHAEDMLRRAASESHQRVAEADEAVRKLVSLRSELQQQILDLSGRLGDLSDTMTTVRKTLEPLALENQRPSPDSFPAEPAAIGSSSTEVFTSTIPQWHPPAPPVSLSWEKVSAQLETAAEKDAPANAPEPPTADAEPQSGSPAADEPEPDSPAADAEPKPARGEKVTTAAGDKPGSPAARARSDR